MAVVPTPVLLSPGSGSGLTSPIRFTWSTPYFNGGFAFRRHLVGSGSYQWWDYNAQAWSSTEKYNALGETQASFPASAWTGGGSYQWTVSTRDASFQTSDYAAEFLVVLNVAPASPTLLAPVGNVAVDVAVPQRFVVTNNDPDDGDTTSVLAIRYRPVGAGSWTTLTQQSPLLFRDIAAGTFTAGVSYEWQAQVTDAGGLLGPWSGSEFFTGATVPAAPTITSPVNNATIALPTGGLVTWSTANQDAYQLRVVADSAGIATTSTVFYDSGTVADPAARSTTVDRPVNGRTEHTQVRVRYQGLWSNYGDVRNPVQYTLPAVPALGLATTADAVQVTISHRAPVSTEPAVVYTDVYRRRTGTTSSLRVARNRPAGALLDYSIGSGIDYEYQAVAVGSNGSTSATAWLGAATVVVVPPTPTGTAGAYGTGVYGEGSFS